MHGAYGCGDLASSANRPRPHVVTHNCGVGDAATNGNVLVTPFRRGVVAGSRNDLTLAKVDDHPINSKERYISARSEESVRFANNIRSQSITAFDHNAASEASARPFLLGTLYGRGPSRLAAFRGTASSAHL